ncbi:MAG: NAD-dependent epimerase/dehydratase family protein [Armatimonadetes bacterium]|nr:NAD-dependent epimerase/dehydratase family protein [Armatimonadota bacterium]
MRILVTGARGFLGRGIAERLMERGEQVAVLVRSSDDALARRGAEMVLTDLGDRDRVMAACAGRDLVYHVAAKAGIWGPREEYFRSNVEGARNILDGCRKHRVPRLVYTSSPSVTFDGGDAVNANESLPYPSRFENDYCLTKATAEREILEAGRKREVATCAIRPHLIWGPGDPHLIPRVVAAARAGRLMQVGDGRNLVDITYVDNAVDAHLQAGDALSLDSPLNGQPYFISQGEPVALWPWINGLLEKLGVAPIKKQISMAAARRIGAVLEGAYRLLGLKSEPRMTRFLAAQLGTSHYYDISAARRDFGYAPRVASDEGMDRLIAWLKASR